MFKKISILLLWILIFCKVCYTFEPRSCVLDVYSGCSQTEYCDENSKQCNCLKGLDRHNISWCVPKTTDEQTTPQQSQIVVNEDSASITPFVLTTLFLFVIVFGGIYIHRKYDLVTWFKYKLRRRNDVFFMTPDLNDDL